METHPIIVVIIRALHEEHLPRYHDNDDATAAAARPMVVAAHAHTMNAILYAYIAIQEFQEIRGAWL